MIHRICRSLYAFAVVALIGSTSWTAGGMKSERQYSATGMGIVLLAALQR